MPETAESVPKENPFIVGIVDLFSVILPGAMITFWVAKTYSLSLLSGDAPWETRTWIIFLVISYVSGHVISGLGGIFLDKIYDKTYKLGDPDEREEYIRLRLRAHALTQRTLSRYYSAEDNVLKWAEAFVRLSNAAAGAEIDRLEAESKFFRSLSLVLILGWSAYCFSPRWKWHWGWVSFLSFLALVIFYAGMKIRGSISSELKERKKELLDRLLFERRRDSPLELEVTAEAQANHEVSGGLRSGAQVAFAAWAVFVALPPISGFNFPQRWFGVGCAALGLFSIYRYMEKRLQRTEQTYRYLIACLGVSSSGEAVRHHRRASY